MTAFEKEGGDMPPRLYPEEPYGLRSEAERDFYEACKALPGDWVVFANVPVVERQYEGEVDFVLAHPEIGILIAEVKGGQVGFDPVSGRWYSIDRNRVRHELDRSPFEQAQVNARRIVERLRAIPVTQHHRYPFAWVVVLPDVEVPSPLSTYPEEVIIDRNGLGDLERRLRRAAGFLVRHPWSTRDDGVRALRALERVLGQSIWTRRPLRVVVDELQTEMRRMSEDQYRMLRWLWNQREALVFGCAGSGKTFLATRLACELYRQGLRVLLTCFNRPLSDWLETVIYNELRREEGPTLDFDRMVVKNYHQLVQILAAQHDMRLPQDIPDPRAPVWFETLDAIAKLTGPRYDAIIVDEAQDFDDLWWLPLQDLRVPGGYLYLFLDDNQRIYTPPSTHLPLREPRFWLSRTIRFTQPIHDLVVQFYRGDNQPDPPPFPGERPVIRTDVRLRQDQDHLRRLLHQVLGEGQVAPQDVVLLTPVAQERSALQEGKHLGDFILTWQERLARQGRPYVLVSTIHRFKGLERPVVILVELERMETWQPAARQMMLYVGLSRASARLYLLGGRQEWFEGAVSNGEPVMTFERQIELEREVERLVAGTDSPPDLAAQAPSRGSLVVSFREAVQQVASGHEGRAEVIESGESLIEAASGAEEDVASVDDPPRQLGPSDLSAAQMQGESERERWASGAPTISEVEAVWMECDPSTLVDNAWVSQWRKAGKARVTEEPPGLIVQAYNNPLPAGRLEVVRRLHPLPFTRTAWLVVVRGEGPPPEPPEVDGNR